jgi:hypothetical protein
MTTKPLQLIDDTTRKNGDGEGRTRSGYSNLQRSASVTSPMLEKNPYTLIIPDSAFKDIYENYNDSTAFRFITFEKTETGNLLLKVTTDSLKNYFYEFRSADGTLVASKRLKRGIDELRFTSLRPGKYSLKVVEDMNVNNRWDSGGLLEAYPT